MKKNKKCSTPKAQFKSFEDMIAPSVIRFFTDHYICGNTYRCVYALREYPTSTAEQAILRRLGEKDGVTLHIYSRQVKYMEEKKILDNASNKNRMYASADNMKENIKAQNNLQDVADVLSNMQRNREPLIHCAVYIELIANDFDSLKQLQTEVLTELVRSKLNVDRLILRQKEGFLSASPTGRNALGSQLERVLPVSSVANLFPLNYSGKTNSNGFYLGKDKFGSNIIVDFNQRDEDKTNANILILGNSGQGKSYLLKLILCNILESGKNVIVLDPEHEFADLCENLGGCFVDLMSGQYMINPLEPKSWDTGEELNEKGVPSAFVQSTKLSQHISFLKDFFRSYKDFDDRHIDTVEIMLSKLYSKWSISDSTDFTKLRPTDYPILSDLYALIEMEYRYYDNKQSPLYPKDLLQDILLGLHSMCEGAESKFFNGHTNVTSDRFIVFGVKGLLQASQNVKNALLFNVLSYMSDRLITVGNTVAALDELYLFLTNKTVIEYIRSFMKRVRKKESAVVLSSQNLEDFALPGIAELTKPLFSIPVHQFLFNAGSVDSRFYMDTLQLEESEYKLIKYPQQGVCLYKCGNERYNLAVHAPEYKETLFGTAGGRQMAAVSGAAVAKIAATVLTDKKLRKGVGWLLAAVLSPLILFIVMLCTLLSATSQHNTAAADLCFCGGEISENTPDDYRRHIEEMQSAFAIVDSEVARINAMTENGNGLDGTHVKSVFYALYFGTDCPNSVDIQDFVDSFVRYEERTTTYTDAEGNEAVVFHTVAIPLPMDTVYSRLPITVTAIQKESAADVFEHISDAGDSFTGDILRGEGGETKIDVSGFTDISTKNSHDLVAYAQQAFENGWGYVWGTCGWVLTPQMFASKLSQYPDGVGKYKNFIEENWLNGRTTDCVGLIKGYGWLNSSTLEVCYGTNGMPDISADQMYQVATTKGSMSTMPDTPGLAVWHKGHIGVYIGNGEVIEAMGTKYGVVKTKLQDRNWTAWLEIPYINYERTTVQ